MGAIGADGVASAAHSSPLYAKYGQTVDRESAYEKLTAKMAQAPAPEQAPEAAPAERPARSGRNRVRWSRSCPTRR